MGMPYWEHYLPGVLLRNSHNMLLQAVEITANKSNEPNKAEL